jgi:hypothetical protein
MLQVLELAIITAAATGVDPLRATTTMVGGTGDIRHLRPRLGS